MKGNTEIATNPIGDRAPGWHNRGWNPHPPAATIGHVDARTGAAFAGGASPHGHPKPEAGRRLWKPGKTWYCQGHPGGGRHRIVGNPGG